MNPVPDRLNAFRTLALLVMVIACLAILSSCVREDDLTADQRAYSLDREFMCPVCDGQTLDQSHAQVSLDMKQVIREKIAAGESNHEIRDYFVARYGEQVLAAPEASGFNLLVWLMPAVIGGGGALAVFWVLKNMKRGTSAAPPARPTPSPDPAQLEKYLQRVDADMGLGTTRQYPGARAQARQESEN